MTLYKHYYINMNWCCVILWYILMTLIEHMYIVSLWSNSLKFLFWKKQYLIINFVGCYSTVHVYIMYCTCTPCTARVHHVLHVYTHHARVSAERLDPLLFLVVPNTHTLFMNTYTTPATQSLTYSLTYFCLENSFNCFLVLNLDPRSFIFAAGCLYMTHGVHVQHMMYVHVQYMLHTWVSMRYSYTRILHYRLYKYRVRFLDSKAAFFNYYTFE
jgi:hypothetical protein